MEIYLQVFVNYKSDDLLRLLFIAQFTYLNMKNASTGHTSCELNYCYYY